MKVKDLRSIIRESIKDRISNIDHAGKISGHRGKLDQINKDIAEINQIKQDYANIENLEHYVQPKTLQAFGKDLDKSLGDLMKAKAGAEKELDKIENGKVKPTTSKNVEKQDDSDSIDLGDSGEEPVEEPKKQVAEARKRKR